MDQKNACSNLANAIVERAKASGLTEEEAAGFPLWVANEVFEGREVANLMVLLERTPELVKIFRAEKRTQAERTPPHVGPDNTCKRCGDYWPCGCVPKT